MAKSISNLKTLGEDDPKKNAEVSTKLRGDWNNYTTWLKGKGMQGHPSLDKNDLGGQMIDQYQKENPTTSVNRAAIIPIQQELIKYRNYAINELRNKRWQLVDSENPNGRFVTPTENLDTYMKDLSIDDGYAGSKTTNYKFPEMYMKTFLNNKLQSNVNQGFVTSSPPIQPISNQIVNK